MSLKPRNGSECYAGFIRLLLTTQDYCRQNNKLQNGRFCQTNSLYWDISIGPAESKSGSIFS